MRSVWVHEFDHLTYLIEDSCSSVPSQGSPAVAVHCLNDQQGCSNGNLNIQSPIPKWEHGHMLRSGRFFNNDIHPVFA